MDNDVLWSLRLGFTSRQASALKKLGAKEFVRRSAAAKYTEPDLRFIKESPRTQAQIKELAKQVRTLPFAERKLRVERLHSEIFSLKADWIKTMVDTEFPLREKMTLFWQNHFVVAHFKVKSPMVIYDHHKLLRENAFGNFRELTKKAIRTNAMNVYLDGAQNRKGSYNENLSRELLELFTLGQGNYTEQDIKNGAKGLAGLVPGDARAEYRTALRDSSAFKYFGKTGSFDSDAMVDIIFEQPAAPFHITRKILKWLIYDNPPDELVKYYGNYLRDKDYEIAPLLEKIVTEEYNKPTAGAKIKDPLLFILQLMDELGMRQPDYTPVAVYVRNQGMDLFNQPNVKGWDGGRTWLTAQSLQGRNSTADTLCKGKNLSKSYYAAVFTPADNYVATLPVNLKWDAAGNNKDVIAGLRDRLLFSADGELQSDFEEILKHDFNPKAPAAENAVLRLFNFMVKTPEFQLI